MLEERLDPNLYVSLPILAEFAFRQTIGHFEALRTPYRADRFANHPDETPIVDLTLL